MPLQTCVGCGPFTSKLTERLIGRLGSSCKIWFDNSELRTGQNVPEELSKASRASAGFIAVLSPNYRGSKWCEKELAAFLEEAEKKDGLETGGYGRLLKVIKFPWEENAHRKFYSKYKDVSFYGRDAESGTEREFRLTSAGFRNAVDELSADIGKLFQAMLRGFEKVFVARAAEDAGEERDSLVLDIRAVGYALSPSPLGDIPRGIDREEIRKYIREAARVSVHPLGAAFDPTVREQIDDALLEGKKVVFYLTRGHEAASGEQRTLIEEIRANKWGLRAGSYELLVNRYQRQDLIDLLRPLRPAAATGNGAARVYLLCDPTSEDVGFAREVQGKIREKEKFDVALPQVASDSSSPAAEHERLLRWCDGLLLYRQKAPFRWYSRNFNDLVTAADRARERDLRSKGLLVGGSNVEIPDVEPGLTVIERHDPFEIEQLEPFLAKLRTVPAGQGDAAYAGS